MITENLLSSLNFTSNIKCLMEQNKLSAVELAKQISVSPELIVKLKRGTLNNPTLKVLIKIATYFNVSIADMVFADFSSNRSLNRYFVDATSYVPVFDWEQMKNSDGVPSEDSVKEYTVVLKRFERNVFALKLNSDYGIFAANALIFIDPSLTLQNNSYVLVKNIATSVISVRKVIADDEYYLQSIIPEINTTVKYNSKEYQIFGILVGYQKLDFFRI